MVNNINAQAQRMAMKVRGKKNAKPKGKKPVKVSSKLRKQVKQIVNAKDPRGRYDKFLCVSIGQFYNGTTSGAHVSDHLINGTALEYPLAAYTAPGTNAIVQGLTYTTNNGTQGTLWAGGLWSTQLYAAGLDWNFFTPRKFLDAASVLFNKKDAAVDYNLGTGNFVTCLKKDGTANGLRGLKIHVRNSYVSVEMKNNTMRVMCVDFYHCVSKAKFADKLPLQTFLDSCQSAAQTLENGDFQQPGFATMMNKELANLIGMEPNMLKNFNSAYKYEKISMRMQPGECCTHSIPGPRNIEVDFSKLFVGGTDRTSALTKIGTSVFAKVYPDLCTATSIAATAVCQSGHYFTVPDTVAAATVTRILLPISLKFREHYDLSLPEQVGFTVPAGGIPGAGTNVILNNRTDKRSIFMYPSAQPYAPDTTSANGATQIINEENPSQIQVPSVGMN